MSERVYIRPLEGKTIHDPETRKPLLAEGRFAVLDHWWRRRLDEGSIEVVDGVVDDAASPAGDAGTKE